MATHSHSVRRKKEKKSDPRRTKSPSRVRSCRRRLERKYSRHCFKFFRTRERQSFPLRHHRHQSRSTQRLRAKVRASSISRSFSSTMSRRHSNSGIRVRSSREQPSLSKDEKKESVTRKKKEQIAEDSERNRAIRKKQEQIEEVYRKDCNTFGSVTKMLLAKDPSLEKQIQKSLLENLKDIGKRCVQAMENFIHEYDFRDRGVPSGCSSRD